jgi:hypothetical protein
MQLLRHCIEESIRETPADLLSRLESFIFIVRENFCFVYLENLGVVVQMLVYGIKMFRIVRKHNIDSCYQ